MPEARNSQSRRAVPTPAPPLQGLRLDSSATSQPESANFTSHRMSLARVGLASAPQTPEPQLAVIGRSILDSLSGPLHSALRCYSLVASLIYFISLASCTCVPDDEQPSLSIACKKPHNFVSRTSVNGFSLSRETPRTGVTKTARRLRQQQQLLGLQCLGI
jgi:hypothetical protein